MLPAQKENVSWRATLHSKTDVGVALVLLNALRDDAAAMIGLKPPPRSKETRE